MLKRSFTAIKNTLNRATISTHTVLASAPKFIYIRQATIENIRSRNRGLESKFKKSAQVLSILLIIFRWHRGNLASTTKKKS
ncbi:hypothetical protein NIES4071_04340 [Calothrix sp. NIES-4071]|nr:hypothetical protein NIES4071_04340 [Calothrix sp. NIES-4071]BAZ54780.1 hypothetical protein NIES4105_04330 [Calothrix sp. NIES-4105]